MITVEQPGLSCVQHLGRAAASQVGQMTAGATDQYDAKTANVLEGSPATAPVIELVAQDFVAVSAVDILVAVTGADADLTPAGRPQPEWEPVVWRAGQTLRVSRLRAAAAPPTPCSVRPDPQLRFVESGPGTAVSGAPGSADD